MTIIAAPAAISAAPQPVFHVKRLAQEQGREQHHEHHAQLVHRSHPRGRTELQRPVM